MAALVIAEHDNASIRGATLNTVAAASQLGGEVHILVAGSGCRAAADAAAKIAGVSKVLHGRRREPRPRAGREPRRAGGGARPVGRLQPSGVSGHRRRQERRAARRRPARHGAGLGHHQGDRPRHFRAADLRRQRHRHRAVGRRGEGAYRSHHRLRCGGGRRRQRRRREHRRAGRCGNFELRRLGDRQERPARAHRREDHRLGRTRARFGREVHRAAHAAGRQARRGARRQPRGGRCGLRAERLAGRADRQDRGTARSTSPAASRAPSSIWRA